MKHDNITTLKYKGKVCDMTNKQLRNAKNLALARKARAEKKTVHIKLYTRAELDFLEEHGFLLEPSHMGRHWYKIESY